MIQSVITFVVTSIISALGGYLISMLKNAKIREDNQKTTLQALLRNAITTKYYIYIQLGSIPIWERENLIHLFEEYKKQGGNSYVAMIMTELLKLPVEDTPHNHSDLTSKE